MALSTTTWRPFNDFFKRFRSFRGPRPSGNTAMTTARVTAWTDNQRVAPLLVVFDCSLDAGLPVPTANGSGDPDPALFHYSWNFGDSAVNWDTTGKSKNVHTGYITAHVYETAGTYTVTLTITKDDGTVVQFDQSIVVTDADTIYSGATFYCARAGDTPAGNNSNEGTEAAPWLTAQKAISTAGVFSAAGPRRVLFKRGTEGATDYVVTANASISGLAGPYHIGAYGSGDDPVIHPADGIDGIAFDKTTTGVRIVDVSIMGPAHDFGGTNFDFATDTVWTKGVNWTISGGTAVGTLATADLSQAIPAMEVGSSYTVRATYTITAGSLVVKLGTAASSAVTAGTVSKTITCAGSADLIFTGTGFTGTIDNIRMYTNGIGVRPGTDCLFLRMAVNKMDSAFSSSDAHGTKNGIGVVECTIGDELGSYGHYQAMAYQAAWLGNTITLSGSRSNEHCLRVYPTHSVISHNIFEGGATGKTLLRAAGYFATGDASRDGDEATETVEYLVVSDNIFQNIASVVSLPVMFGVTNSGDAQFMQNCVIERNKATAGSGTTRIFEIDSPSYCTIRNNLWVMTASLANRPCQVHRSGAGSPTPTGNQVLFNSIYAGGAYTGGGIRLGSLATDSICNYNWLVKTSGAGTVTSQSSDVNSTLTGNVTSTTGMVSPPTDMRPAAASDAENAGVQTDYVYDDYNMMARANPPDAGAYEVGSA